MRVQASVNNQTREESALIQRAQEGDERAFQEIVERYQSKVFSIIYGILRNHNDAEDIAQQVFAKVYLSIRRFDRRSSLLTWIYKITVNECYDYLRKRKVRKLVYESDFSEQDTLRLASAAEAQQREKPIDTALATRDLARKLLMRLPEEDRLLLVLKEVEGHSIEELADFTGMNQNTIKVKLFRARQKLLGAAKRLTGKASQGAEA